MKKIYFYLPILLISFLVNSSSLASSLQPEAATIWDAYFPDGGHRANSDRLFPVIPTIGYSSEAPSYSFYFDREVDLLKPGIDVLHERGIKYYMFLEFAVLEVEVDSILASDPSLSGPDFGKVYNFDGTVGHDRSINRPEYRDFFLRCIKRGIDAGADGIQIDMAGGEFLDSFDPDDVAAFNVYLKNNYPATLWTSEGIANIDTLDYRKWLYNYKGITEFPITFDPNSPVPFARHWLLFKIQRIQDSWKALSDSAKAYAMNNYGREFTIIGNNYAFGKMGQHGMQTMGDVCGEYFGYTTRYPLKGTTTTRHKALQAIGKRNLIWSTPSPDVECLCNHVEFDQHMVAESFASGGLAQFAGERNERDGYAKYFNLVQTQRELLNSVWPKGEIGVILAMPTTVCAWGTIEPHEGAQLLMQDLGRSYEVIVFGTNLGWPDTIEVNDLTKYKMLVLHEAIFLTDHQVSVLLDYVNQGGKLMVFGTGLAPGWTGGQDENGQDRNNPTWQALVNGETRITNYGAGKVAYIKEITDPNDGNCRIYYRYVNTGDAAKETIAADIINTVRIYTDSLVSKENIRVDLSDKVTIFRSEDQNNHDMLYHLVSHDVDTITRLHNTLINKTVELKLSEGLKNTDSVFVTLFSPDDPEGTELGNLAVDSERVSITVPSLFIWDMIKITGKQTGTPIKVRSLNITNAINDYILPYNGFPSFGWQDVSNKQQQYQLQLWSNALCYGTAFWDTGWITSADTTLAYSGPALTEGRSYFTRLRIKSAENDTSEWINTTFHLNKRPDAPTHLYGISAVIETTPNVPFWWAEARDMEGDTLKYFFELYTDSVSNNFSDSINLYPVYTSGYSMHKYDGLDGVTDTIDTNIDVDNYGFWWRVYSYDGINNSDPSRWARFTWDHMDDAPRSFNLISPVNKASIRNSMQLVSFNWETNGDPDPNSTNIADYDVLISESADFTTGVQTFTCTPALNFNPFITTGHKIMYWKVLAKDNTGPTRWSNQTWMLYADDGTNTAPTKPILSFPAIGASVDSTSYLKWQLSTDTQLDSIFYTIQIDPNSAFTSPIVVKTGIFDTTPSDVQIRISDLPNYTALVQGTTYYWRVQAKDNYINGVSTFSNPRNFVYNNTVDAQENSIPVYYYVYPNPVVSSSVLQLSNELINNGVIEIWNAQGTTMCKSDIKTEKILINKNDYKAGVFFYRISDRDGNQYTGKFIVE